VVEEDLLCEEE